MKNKTTVKTKVQPQKYLDIDKYIKCQTTHYCLGSFLAFAKCIGIFPLQNITNANPTKLKFKLLSPYVCYSIILLVTCSLCSVLSAVKTLSHNSIMHRLVSPLFYFHITSTIIININLSRNWTKLTTLVYKEEIKFLQKYKPQKCIKTKIDLIILMVTLMCTCEHILAVSNFALSKDCLNEARGLEHYIRKQYHYIYDYFNYNICNGIFFLILSWVSVYIWNFGDLLIIATSIIYTYRCNQITDKIKWYIKSNKSHNNALGIFSEELRNITDKFWRDIRKDFAKISEICDTTSNLFGTLILFTYSCNLMFILVQLFVSLRPREQTVEILYFVCSFTFVVTRVLMSSIYGGLLYEAGKSALPILNAVPSEMYTAEVARLINQIHISSPNLTGLHFFRITKGLVLSIAASLITYELAIIQFNRAELEHYLTEANETICY